MTQSECIQSSRDRQLVEPDKFDRHMTQARTSDIESRKAIFCSHAEHHQQKMKEHENIVPAVY